MHPPKCHAFTLICLVIVASMFAVSCSDDDNPAAPVKEYTWSPLGTGLGYQVISVTVYDNKLIAGGHFTTAGGTSANHIAAWGPK